jgi:predicted DNA binding CopG/RHH family protein
VVRNKLDAEEREIVGSYERGEWQSVATPEELRRYQTLAAATLSNQGLISINLSPEDLEAIQKKAHEEGIPYQILIANIIHQFVTGHLVERA